MGHVAVEPVVSGTITVVQPLVEQYSRLPVDARRMRRR